MFQRGGGGEGGRGGGGMVPTSRYVPPPPHVVHACIFQLIQELLRGGQRERERGGKILWRTSPKQSKRNFYRPLPHPPLPPPLPHFQPPHFVLFSNLIGPKKKLGRFHTFLKSPIGEFGSGSRLSALPTPSPFPHPHFLFFLLLIVSKPKPMGRLRRVRTFPKSPRRIWLWLSAPAAVSKENKIKTYFFNL